MSDDLVHQMSLPGFYGLPADAEIRHVQTHISHVFLTGTFAYKVKKPVDLGFLDFSTPEKREHFCREELRLNRRFAPALYLDVVPIHRSGDRFAFDPPRPGATPVEFALKMRQFGENDLLTDWLRDGKLTESHVRDIARKMVRLHREAQTNARVAAFGMPDAVEKMTADNFAMVRKFVGRAIDSGQFERIHSAVAAALRANRPRIEQRVRNGRIRECHGDLHLRNLCWFDGEIQFFDCIEFNEEYRCIDVMYELAFLAMDLGYRGCTDLANALINEYVERSGDYDGAALLPPYISLRAWIRAKVACLMQDDDGLSPAEQAEARSSATKHFDYADERLRPRTPALAIVCGVSGTGKSTVARELAKRLDAIHVRSDAVRKHLAGVDLDTHTDAIYSAEATERTYAALTNHARALLRAGWNVILDATYQHASHRAAVHALARELGVPFRILHLTAPEAILRERIAARTKDISDAPTELPAAQLAVFEAITQEERPRTLAIDTTHPIDYDAIQKCVALQPNTTGMHDQ